MNVGLIFTLINILLACCNMITHGFNPNNGSTAIRTDNVRRHVQESRGADVMTSSSPEKRTAHVEDTPSLTSTTTLHSFWGQSRTKEEIRKHVAQTVFPNEQYIRTRKRIQILSSDLPLITIDNFLSKEQCNQIIQAAKESSKGMAQSTMGVSQQISKSRTSSTLWLHEYECEVPLRTLAGKVSRLIGLDASHMENLQVVKYEEGQKFDLHTDHLDSFNDLQCRGRLATCLVYLNSSSSGRGDGDYADDDDDDEIGEFQGGCTYFPEYEEYVFPRQGRAVFWFNTIEKPGSDGYSGDMFLNADLKSRHSASAVYNGEKWVCNRWVHPVSLEHGVRGDE